MLLRQTEIKNVQTQKYVMIPSCRSPECRLIDSCIFSFLLPSYTFSLSIITLLSLTHFEKKQQPEDETAEFLTQPNIVAAPVNPEPISQYRMSQPHDIQVLTLVYKSVFRSSCCCCVSRIVCCVLPLILPHQDSSLSILPTY